MCLVFSIAVFQHVSLQWTYDISPFTRTFLVALVADISSVNQLQCKNKNI